METTRGHQTYNLGQNKAPFPPNQGWSRVKAKTRHCPITDFGGRGGLNFPFNLSKIVVTSLETQHVSIQTLVT